MRVVAEPVEQFEDVLVGVGVERHLVRESREFILRRELTLQEEVRHLEEATPVGELLDRVAAVPQDSPAPVDVGYAAPRGRRVGVRRIVRHHPEVVRVETNLAQIHRPDYFPVENLQFVLLPVAVVPDGKTVPGTGPALTHGPLRMCAHRLCVGPSRLQTGVPDDLAGRPENTVRSCAFRDKCKDTTRQRGRATGHVDLFDRS